MEKIKLKCLNCEKEFEISTNNKRQNQRKFCSSSCSATFNNKKRDISVNDQISESLKNKIKKILPNCTVCGNIVKKSDSKYCSNSCHAEGRNIAYIADWKNNIVDGMRGKDSISRFIRRYLFEKYDNKNKYYT